MIDVYSGITALLHAKDTWIIAGGMTTVGLGVHTVLRGRRHGGARRERRRTALLSAEIRDTGYGHRLYIMNAGRTEARDVRVYLDDAPLSEHAAALSNDTLSSQVGPGRDISCFLTLSAGCVPPFSARILWNDDSGPDHSHATTLTL